MHVADCLLFIDPLAACHIHAQLDAQLEQAASNRQHPLHTAAVQGAELRVGGKARAQNTSTTIGNTSIAIKKQTKIREIDNSNNYIFLDFVFYLRNDGYNIYNTFVIFNIHVFLAFKNISL